MRLATRHPHGRNNGNIGEEGRREGKERQREGELRKGFQPYPVKIDLHPQTQFNFRIYFLFPVMIFQDSKSRKT